MRVTRYVLIGVAIIGLAASLGYIVFQPSQPRHASVDSAVLTADRLDGSTMSFADVQGDILIIDFWATWCAPCITEIPHYNELHADYKDKGVHLIGITLESGSAEDVTAFMEDLEPKIEYPLVMGNDAVIDAWGPIWGFPTTVLIDSTGKTVKTWLGATSNKSEQIRALLDEMLGEEAPAEASSSTATVETAVGAG